MYIAGKPRRPPKTRPHLTPGVATCKEGCVEREGGVTVTGQCVCGTCVRYLLHVALRRDVETHGNDVCDARWVAQTRYIHTTSCYESRAASQIMLSNRGLTSYGAVHLNHAVRCDTVRSGVHLVRRHQIRVRPNKPSSAVYHH